VGCPHRFGPDCSLKRTVLANCVSQVTSILSIFTRVQLSILQCMCSAIQFKFYEIVLCLEYVDFHARRRYIVAKFTSLRQCAISTCAKLSIPLDVGISYLVVFDKFLYRNLSQKVV
jgi:hypothetical protein